MSWGWRRQSDADCAAEALLLIASDQGLKPFGPREVAALANVFRSHLTRHDECAEAIRIVENALA
jgi:hypothetical protein